MTRLTLLVVAVLSTAAVGCGDDPVSYSDPVGMSLSVASGDVDNGALADEKNINTESGNPYGAFSSAAQMEIGGPPSSIVVEAATLAIETSTGAAALEEVFAGDVEVAFVMSGSNVAYPVALRTISAGDGAGPVDLDVGFDSDAFTEADYADLVDGSFKVVLSGDAAPGFADASANVDLSLILTFTAYE